MSLTLGSERVPLHWDQDDTLRVGGTRVTLDSIVYMFQEGASPEEIAQDFPSVGLADIYFVLGFYLRQREDVEAYMRHRRTEAEELRAAHELRFDPTGIRERLLARQNKAQGQGK